VIESDRDSVFVPLLTVGRQTQLDGDCSLGSFECIGPTGRATFSSPGSMVLNFLTRRLTGATEADA